MIRHQYVILLGNVPRFVSVCSILSVARAKYNVGFRLQKNLVMSQIIARVLKIYLKTIRKSLLTATAT